MARLTARQRRALPAKDFAGPDRSFPVENKPHAIAAKSMVARYGSPALKKRVDARADRVIDRSPPRKGRGLLGV